MPESVCFSMILGNALGRFFSPSFNSLWCTCFTDPCGSQRKPSANERTLRRRPGLSKFALSRSGAGDLPAFFGPLQASSVWVSRLAEFSRQAYCRTAHAVRWRRRGRRGYGRASRSHRSVTCGELPGVLTQTKITRSSWLPLYESELLCDHGVEHSRRKKPG